MEEALYENDHLAAFWRLAARCAPPDETTIPSLPSLLERHGNVHRVVRVVNVTG